MCRLVVVDELRHVSRSASGSSLVDDDCIIMPTCRRSVGELATNEAADVTQLHWQNEVPEARSQPVSSALPAAC